MIKYQIENWAKDMEPYFSRHKKWEANKLIFMNEIL